MVREKIRLQVNISARAQEDINDLKNKLNLQTTSDVIRSSLTLAKYLELQKDAGNEIIIRDKNTKKEKELIFLGN